jgi:dCMP deaminase
MELSKAKKYYELANYQAQLFSKDPNTKVAAIIIAPDSLQILSTGFNGLCRKVAETPERWARPLKYTWCCHAEMNAVANAARSGVKIEGAICVITMFPCVECCKILIQSGITTVITPQPDMNNTRWAADFALSKSMFDEVCIHIIYVD